MMGRSRFLLFLLVSSLLFLSFGHGFGRVELMEKKSLEHRHPSTEAEEHESEMRKMLEIMDYPDPEPNPKNGHNFSPPSPTPASPPHGYEQEEQD